MLFPTWVVPCRVKMVSYQAVHRHISLGWSMCDIRFCISWPEKITRCTSHISTDSVRLVYMRDSRFSLNDLSIGAHLRILMVIASQCVIAGKYHSDRAYCIRFCIFLARKIKNLRFISHISTDSVRSRCAIFGFVFIGQKKSQDAYRTSRPIRFGWSMCDIRFCIYWPEKITRCTSHISTDSVRLVDVRYSVLYFLARKEHKMHIAHLNHCGEQKVALSPIGRKEYEKRR